MASKKINKYVLRKAQREFDRQLAPKLRALTNPDGTHPRVITPPVIRSPSDFNRWYWQRQKRLEREQKMDRRPLGRSS